MFQNIYQYNKENSIEPYVTGVSHGSKDFDSGL
jgi:hypothetical protein